MGTLIEEHGRRLVLLLRPEVIRTDADLQRVLAKKRHDVVERPGRQPMP
jgi:hypothetical protein